MCPQRRLSQIDHLQRCARWSGKLFSMLAMPEARADDEFILALARLQSGVLIGDKYASRSFMRLCEFSGAKILEFLQAAQINSTIPGLGCLSPVSVTFDSVSVGDTSFAWAETFQIVCVTAIDSCTGLS